MSKCHKPPLIEKLLSLCNSSYDSNSPYILHEKINDIRNKLLNIDKQLLEIVEVDEEANETRPKNKLQIETGNSEENQSLGASENQEIYQFKEIGNNIRGIRSASSSRLNKSGMKHSMLIPQCKEMQNTTMRLDNENNHKMNM